MCIFFSQHEQCGTVWVKFYWGQNEDGSPGNSISDSSEELLQRGRSTLRSVCIWFYWRRLCVIKHTFWHRFAAGCGEWMSLLMSFSAFLDYEKIQKNQAQKIFSSKYLSEALFCQFFPEHRLPHFWSLPWTFRVCQKSAAAVASDLILIEADGKCQFLVGALNDLIYFTDDEPRPPKKVSYPKSQVIGYWEILNQNPSCTKTP